jgi:hypothetical protein
VSVSLASVLRARAWEAAEAREAHAALLDVVAAGLDEDGFPAEASRARARAETLREVAADDRATAA